MIKFIWDLVLLGGLLIGLGIVVLGIMSNRE